MSILLNILYGFVIIFVSIYIWFKYKYGYWKRKNVFSPPAKFPFGHMSSKIPSGFYYMKVYNEYKNIPYVGLFMLAKKLLLINDLDLIKNILTKDFIHFQGHSIVIKSDPLEQHLFNLEGEEWKRIRVKLSPTFTSSKMKFMFDTMLSCTEEMVHYLNEEGKISTVFDVKELIAKLGTNVIGSCAFGIETNCFKDPDAEFRKMGKTVFEMKFRDFMLNVLIFVAPELVNFLKMTRNKSHVIKFFQRIVKETIEYREKNDIRRNDFLQLLIDMKNADEKSGTQLSLPEITAQVFVFFIAGFETSSTAATYTLLELAKNADLQQKLVTQIEDALKENDGKITYDVLNKMTFMNNLIEETLRMYPPLPLLFRSCSKEYQIPGTSTIIEKDTFVMIPILAIQRDPEIYPDPETFDPDRFKPENVSNRHFSAYLPFGEGPRICIGNRFGMMQVKLAILMILRNFNVELSEKTKLPLEFDPLAFLLHTKGEMFLNLTPRK